MDTVLAQRTLISARGIYCTIRALSAEMFIRVLSREPLISRLDIKIISYLYERI